MLNKIDKIESYNIEKLENSLNTKIEDLLSNNEFKKYVEKISNKLNSINPTDLKPSIELVENFILELNQPYIEAKEVLNSIYSFMIDSPDGKTKLFKVF